MNILNVVLTPGGANIGADYILGAGHKTFLLTSNKHGVLA